MVKTGLPKSKKSSDNPLQSIFSLTMEKMQNGQTSVSKEKKTANSKRKMGIFCKIFQFALVLVILVMVTLMLTSYIMNFAWQLNHFVSNVELNIVYPKTTKMPAVTVCNYYNGLQKSKYCRIFPSKCANGTITEYDPNIFQEDLSYEKRRRFLQTADEFLTMVEIDNVLVGGQLANINWENFSRIYFEPMINCFTVFGRWDENTENSGRAVVVGGENFELFFELDFQLSEQVNPNGKFPMAPTGGIVFVHDSRSLPDIYHQSGYEIGANEIVSLKIAKDVQHRLPMPYATACREYREDDARNSPMSQMQCFSECIYERFMERCGCIPYYYPQLFPKRRVECTYSNNTEVNCFELENESIKSSCESSCPLSCEEEEYHVQVSKFPMTKAFESTNTSAYVKIEFAEKPLREKMFYHVPINFVSWRDTSLLLLWLLVEIALLSTLIRTVIRCCCRKTKTREQLDLEVVHVQQLKTVESNEK